MLSEKDIERYEQNFRDIFHKLNASLPTSSFIAVMTTLIIVGGSLVGLMYSDQQEHKRIATQERINVIEKISEVKQLIYTIKK
jgi:hypothetical protein